MNLTERLLARQKLKNLRQLKPSLNLIDFASNDTLGLARSFELKQLILNELPSFFHGSTGSRLLTGNSLYAEKLENRIAAFHGFEAGLLFSCGYMANLGLLSAVAASEDRIFFDAGIHASTLDGIKLSNARAFPFRHNDLAHLEKRLQNCPSKIMKWICIDSIYSTDGSAAPLKAISELAKSYKAHLIVDEAHAAGAFGPQGKGLLAELNLNREVFAAVVTFGKAIGTYGAIVMGSSLLKEALINFAKPYIYTTALPFHALAAIKCSYDLFPSYEKERTHLRKLISFFPYSPTHIQPIRCPGNESVKKAQKDLAALGFDVSALMSPTVRRGHESLRLVLHAFNSIEEVKAIRKAHV